MKNTHWGIVVALIISATTILILAMLPYLGLVPEYPELIGISLFGISSSIFAYLGINTLFLSKIGSVVKGAKTIDKIVKKTSNQNSNLSNIELPQKPKLKRVKGNINKKVKKMNKIHNQKLLKEYKEKVKLSKKGINH